MTLDEQCKFIQENKDYVVTLLNAALDTIYNIVDGLKEIKENSEVVTEEIEEAMRAYVEQKNNAEQFEKVRRKIIADDFKLSLLEINQINLAALFCEQVLRNDVERRLKLIDDCNKFQYDLGIFEQSTQV